MSNILASLFNKLDAYLIGDLETMSKIIPTDGERDGRVGYPMVLTILAGMELMGMVISGRKEYNAFDDFWKEFIKDNIDYGKGGKEGLEKILRLSIRNGIAHHFLTKNGIAITKWDCNNLTNLNGNLNIDALIFYKDFKKTYDRIKNKLLNGEDKNFIENCEKGCRGLINNLNNKTMVDIDRLVKSLKTFDYSLLPQSGHSPGNNYSGPSDSSMATLGYGSVSGITPPPKDY